MCQQSEHEYPPQASLLIQVPSELVSVEHQALGAPAHAKLFSLLVMYQTIFFPRYSSKAQFPDHHATDEWPVYIFKKRMLLDIVCTGT